MVISDEQYDAYYSYINGHARGFEGNLKIHKFRIEGGVQSSDAEQIIRSFLANPAVRDILEVLVYSLFFHLVDCFSVK